MQFIERAFSIGEGDSMGGASYVVVNRPPVKEIALAVALLILGTVAIGVGVFMSAAKIGGDRAHGIFFGLLGLVLFIPGFYYTRIAYYAYKGYKGFSFANIPGI